MQRLQPDNDSGLGSCYARVMCSKRSVARAELERGSFRPGSRTCAFVTHNQLTGVSSDVRLQEQISLFGFEIWKQALRCGASGGTSLQGAAYTAVAVCSNDSSEFLSAATIIDLTCETEWVGYGHEPSQVVGPAALYQQGISKAQLSSSQPMRIGAEVYVRIDAVRCIWRDPQMLQALPEIARMPHAPPCPTVFAFVCVPAYWLSLTPALAFNALRTFGHLPSNLAYRTKA